MGSDAVDAKMESYIMALGKVAHAWNYLQEALGQLFVAVTGLEPHVGEEVWHILKNDRAQRDMLRAAILASTHKRLIADFPKAKEDIHWLIEKANSLADKPNDAVHAPMSVSSNGREVELTPMFYYGNPRAHKLMGKDILAEFEWYEHFADNLTRFARAVATFYQSPSKCRFTTRARSTHIN